ncbi:MAG: M15 family metallopeptidase [Bacilli bacterium]|nr:M15 family metallopeptidase [Bacilli bacterium]
MKTKKLKKKNFTLFIISLIIISIGIFNGINLVNNKSNKENKQVINKTSSKKKKLEKLNNINKKISYFNEEYLDRYIAYKEKNKDLNDKQIIKNVNMNLDKKFYENKKEAINQNTELVLVNKYNYLKEDFIPENLQSINSNYALGNMKLVSYAKEAFEKLSHAAKQEKLNIIAMSTYRSYNYQVNLYNRYVENDGKEAADTYSGRPGHSEHQTGLAVDVYNIKETYTNFENTKEFTWMQEHAHEYGFILRFPKDKVNETGYQYESWHYRYVGKEIAKYIKDNKISFEEYCATVKR